MSRTKMSCKDQRASDVAEHHKRKAAAMEKMEEYYKKNRDNGVDLWLDQAMAELEAANRIEEGRF